MRGDTIRHARGSVTALLLALAPWPVAAQATHTVEVAGTVLLVDHRHELPDVGTPTLRGTALGVSATVRAQWLELRGEYAEGRMSIRGAEEGGSVELVEGRASVGVRMVPWLLVHVGPRAYEISGDLARRIVSWQLGTELAFTLVPGVARGFGGAATHLGGSADSRATLGGGATGEVGLRLETPGLPLWGSGSYRIERDNVVAASGSDVTQRLILALGLHF